MNQWYKARGNYHLDIESHTLDSDLTTGPTSSAHRGSTPRVQGFLKYWSAVKGELTRGWGGDILSPEGGTNLPHSNSNSRKRIEEASGSRASSCFHIEVTISITKIKINDNFCVKCWQWIMYSVVTCSKPMKWFRWRPKLSFQCQSTVLHEIWFHVTFMTWPELGYTWLKRISVEITN